MNKLTTKFLLLLPLLLLTSAPAFAVVNIPSIPGTPWESFPNISDFVSTLLNNVYILAGLIMFIIIFFGGFMIISGGAGGDAKKSQQGREAVTWAVVGFIVIFASYWILQIIKVITGVDITKPGI